MQHISSATELQQFIRELSETKAVESKQNLEEYLRSVWKLLLEHRNTMPTWELFCNILSDAFDVEPYEFNEEWRSYISSPNLSSIQNSDQIDSFDYLQRMILFQIADLHKMQEANLLENNLLYFG